MKQKKNQSNHQQLKIIQVIFRQVFYLLFSLGNGTEWFLEMTSRKNKARDEYKEKVQEPHQNFSQRHPRVIKRGDDYRDFIDRNEGERFFNSENYKRESKPMQFTRDKERVSEYERGRVRVNERDHERK